MTDKVENATAVAATIVSSQTIWNIRQMDRRIIIRVERSFCKVQRISIIRWPESRSNHDLSVRSCVSIVPSQMGYTYRTWYDCRFIERGQSNNKVMHENTSRSARRRRNIRKSPDVWIATTCRHPICQVISQVNDDARATSHRFHEKLGGNLVQRVTKSAFNRDEKK